jgi:UDP-N-acetylmuramoylalanine--D-glutamate ligase
MKQKKESILICGFGISGRSAAKLCADLGYDLVIADNGKCSSAMQHSLEELAGKGIQVKTFFSRENSTPFPGRFSKIIVSPGLRKESSLYQAALRSLEEGGHLYGELSFALEHLSCKRLAVTGTNGKTTVTELITHLLKAHARRAEYAGNIGVGLCDFVQSQQQDELDCLCLETSSFQLETLESFGDHPCAILNLASDHLDRHHTLEEYASVKFKLFRDQRSPDRRIMKKELQKYLQKFLPGTQTTTFSATDPEADFTLQGSTICFRNKAVYDMKTGFLQGLHNAENIMAALGLLRAVCSEEALFREETGKALASFRSGPHRMELFAQYNDIQFVNDSKGTNPHAVKASLHYFAKGKNIRLLMGGLDKEMDFTELEEELKCIKKAYLTGACREKIFQYLSGRIPCQKFDSFHEAVHAMCIEAVPGDCVMLSPGTASMDMFANYAERGECFKELIRTELMEMKQRF